MVCLKYKPHRFDGVYYSDFGIIVFRCVVGALGRLEGRLVANNYLAIRDFFVLLHSNYGANE